MAWLAKLLSLVLVNFMEKVGRAIYTLVVDFFVKWKRSREQKKASEKLEKDIKDKAPLSDEQRKNQDDWLNS